MGKVSALDYALMANAVYENDQASAAVAGWSVGSFYEGRSWGGLKADGFQGCFYVRESTKEVVVAFRGTQPTSFNDLTADLKIAIGLLPNQCSSAWRLFEQTLEQYASYDITLTGHSLGGALAQVVGHWSGRPFCTFNAPGMWGDIQKSKINVLAPQKMWRSLKGTFIGSATAKQSANTGRNFRNILDPVSAYGMHYGPVTRFYNAGVHSMSDMVEYVRRSRWADKNPFAHREWGELGSGKKL